MLIHALQLLTFTFCLPNAIMHMSNVNVYKYLDFRGQRSRSQEVTIL